VILMVAEARKHGVKYVWAYFLVGAVTAISVTFPLFLIARELRIAKTDPTVLRRGDTIGLAIVGVAVAAIVIWVDLG
jgi:mannose/fructose/N-acetylgalactosamine-specific phosphotransferase system component IIC